MKDFSLVKFKGVFRYYQQRVLDNAGTFLEDKKLHIVAAPGSGKTTLGLELIRVLDSPALILSPSVTIRSQWGKRFKNGFLPDEENIEDYISFSLLDPKLLTSITYQGLHAAYNKLMDEDESENELEEQHIIVDYSEFDLIKRMKETGIKTVCLDEAHHLRNEWHKALVHFLDALGDEITVIALTATPPYDSTPHEWQKYTALCGEIDEEIFVPELIARNNLCPHQDFIYFNYPSETETKQLDAYKEKALLTVNEIMNKDIFQNYITSFFNDFENEKYDLYENIENYITLVHVAKSLDYVIPKKLRKITKGRDFLEVFEVRYLENLFEFLMSEKSIDESLSDYLHSTLRNAGLIERRKVYLQHSTKLRRQLLSSIGKLNSIGKIAKFESEQLKEELQMLILTDYIKKDMINHIGSNAQSEVMGAVPIFEEVRQSVSTETRIALLSGGLVIVPNCILDNLQETSDLFGASFGSKQLNETKYSIINFKGSNRLSVSVMTRLFELGYIDILIGTKSLLGEGWDSPCINTLILASFVGSFMLSNQMRGRAIRVDRNKPNKVANIWHLATVEPFKMIETSVVKKLLAYDKHYYKQHIVSNDYDVLKRRFTSFLGPSYMGDSITNGIERINIIEPPYDEEGFNSINDKSLEYAKDRELTREKWENAVDINTDNEILDENLVPTEALPQSVIYFDTAMLIASTMFSYTVIFRLVGSLGESFFRSASMVILGSLYLYYVFIVLPRVMSNLTPSKSLKSISNAVLKTLKDIGKIMMKESAVKIEKDRGSSIVSTSIVNGTRHDKAVFASSIKEMISKFDNPRYIIVKYRMIFGKKIYRYQTSYQVPKAIASKKEFVQLLKYHMKENHGHFEVIYTRNETGRMHLIKAKKKSQVNRYQIATVSQKILR